MAQQNISFNFPPLGEFQRARQAKSPLQWWGPIWRGLIVEPTSKHYRAMRSSVWLYLYLVIHADRRTGALYRRLPKVALDMGVRLRSVRYWLSILRKHGYVTTRRTGRAQEIVIAKWRPLQKYRPL